MCYCPQKNPKHLLLAHLFDKPCFLGLLAVQVNNGFAVYWLFGIGMVN